MNKARRAVLNKIINGLNDLLDELNTVKEDEEDAMDNIPESLQGSAMYESMEEAVDHMNDAFDALEDVISSLENAMGV